MSFFSGFLLTCKTNVGKLGPQGPWISFGHHYHHQSSFITGANDPRCWCALNPQIYILVAAAESSDIDKSYADSDVSTLQLFLFAKSVYRRPQRLDFVANRQTLISLWRQIEPGNSHPSLLPIKKRLKYLNCLLMRLFISWFIPQSNTLQCGNYKFSITADLLIEFSYPKKICWYFNMLDI